MTAPDWPPEIGEAVGLARAAAVLERFDDRIRRLWRAAESNAVHKAVQLWKHVYSAEEIAADPRGERMTGLPVAYVVWTSVSGNSDCVRVLLRWDGTLSLHNMREPGSRPKPWPMLDWRQPWPPAAE